MFQALNFVKYKNKCSIIQPLQSTTCSKVANIATGRKQIQITPNFHILRYLNNILIVPKKMNKFIIFIFFVAVGVFPQAVLGDNKPCSTTDVNINLQLANNCCADNNSPKCCSFVNAQQAVSCNALEVSKVVQLTDLVDLLDVVPNALPIDNILCKDRSGNDGNLCSSVANGGGTCFDIFLLGDDKTTVGQAGSVCCNNGKYQYGGNTYTCSDIGCNINDKNKVIANKDGTSTACCASGCN